MRAPLSNADTGEDTWRRRARSRRTSAARKLVKQYAGKRDAPLGDRQRRVEVHGGALRRRASSWRSCRATRSPTRIRNRCEMTGRPRAYYRKLKMSRIALRELGSQGPDPRPRQVELVRRTTMAMNDPLGDMLTRIRNAQMRRKRQGLDARLEAARPRPRRAEVRRLHPRLHRRPSSATAAPSSRSS